MLQSRKIRSMAVKIFELLQKNISIFQNSLANEGPENDVIKSNHRANFRKRETGYYIGSDQKLFHFVQQN